MKLKRHILLFALAICMLSKAQVWYPEGVFLHSEPSLITIDNQVITVGRAYFDATYSYWTVSVSDGKTWNKLPTLVLNKSAELTDISKYQGMIYISGNFEVDNGKYNALVRFDGIGWQGLAKFDKTNQVPAAISSMATHNGWLVLGGGFQRVDSDSMAFLVKYNGFKFSRYFECKGCDPDFPVLDLSASDSVFAISGMFTTIDNHKSKYLYNLNKDGRSDTFIGTPKSLEKIAVIGSSVYGVGGVLKDKRIYRFTGGTITELKDNLDSVYAISEILNYEGKLVICGAYGLKSSTVVRNRVAIRFDNQTWTEITNNFQSPKFIATGRGLLFAIGHSTRPVSIWNPNRSVMRFYPGAALVRAKAFIDANNDCIWDSNEKPAARQFIKLPLVSKGVFTNEDGVTEFFVPNTVTSTFRFVVKPFRNYMRSNCADTSVSKTFSWGQYMDSIQFPLKLVPNINDIKVGIFSPKGKLVLKNKRVVYYLTYSNVGSNPISGKIRLRKNKYFSSEMSVPAQTTINDSTAEWSFANLQPGESKVIVYSALPDASQFDQPYQFDAAVASQITSGSSSYNEDDFDSIPQETNMGISAFRKDVYPTPALGDSVTYLAYEERDLRYNIAFNNFSTDTVFYAVIIDTLDLNLDMSYIEVTGSNKNYYTEVQSDPNNSYKGILIWHFPNIKLAPNPSKDYENMYSGAYIGFKVNTKPLSNGYMLKNVASVYFDNNFAGSTNPVYCTLQLTDVEEVNSHSTLALYPNPGSDFVTLSTSFELSSKISVINASGALVLAGRAEPNQGSIRLDVSGLAPGIYCVLVENNGRIYSRTLVVSR